MCKQDQQVPAIAGGLWQEDLEIFPISISKQQMDFYLPS